MRISVKQLGMTYPNGKKALDKIDFSIEPPNLIGLLGPNGAGKSTLIKLLAAGLLPTEGLIELDGKLLSENERTLKAELGYLPQEFGLYDELTVMQFLDYMAALKCIGDAKAAVTEAMKATNLTGKSKARIRTLSGGQRQRVGIAQALLGMPSFLIFDEPTVGLDPEERIHFRNLFSQMAKNRLMILSTHIIEDVQSVCNLLIVINNGSILFSGRPGELIRTARGHVGVFEAGEAVDTKNLHITARVNTADGVLCRVVAEELPVYAQSVEPSLEDAYLYCITREVRV